MVPDWTTPLAISLVTRTRLSDNVVAGLEEAFILSAEASELRLVLANGGEANTLESFALISQDAVCRELCSVVAVLPVEAPTACVQSMQSEVVLITDQSPEREQLADWVRLSELTPGLRWMLSCPLTGSCHVMGATVVAGCSASPTVDANWLRSWSCEMAHTIAHCSVQVMEASLDMLQRIFPGDMLSSLILKACSPNGEITADMAERLARVLEQGVTPTVALTNPFAEGRPEAAVPSAAAVEWHNADGHTAFAAPGSPGSAPSTLRSSDESTRSLPEPFSEYRQQTTLGAIRTGGGAGSPRAVAAAHLAAPSAAALLRQASQVSIRTEFSYMIADDPGSPCSEEEGYEDLLEEAALEHAQRWASSSMEGARSRQLPSPLKPAAAVESVPTNGTLADHVGMDKDGAAAAQPLSLPKRASAYPASAFDLTFRDARLEKAFQSSLRPAMLRCDRMHVVASTRIASMPCYACFAGSGDGSYYSQRILVQSGLAALVIGPIRYPLLLNVHLPVQLACLWIATAAHASLHRRHLSVLRLPSALALQLGGGMLLPSAAVYFLERRQRQKYLSRRAAARSGVGLKSKTI